MITNYKINQPFSSNFSMEEGEKKSCRTWKHGAGGTVSSVEAFLARNVEGNPYSRNTLKAIRSGLDRFLSGSPQRKPFSIIQDKAFKPANEAIDASLKDLARQGLISFTKHKKLSIERISLAWILLKVLLTQHGFTPFSILEGEAVKINARWNQVTLSWKQQQAGWSTSS